VFLCLVRRGSYTCYTWCSMQQSQDVFGPAGYHMSLVQFLANVCSSFERHAPIERCCHRPHAHERFTYPSNATSLTFHHLTRALQDVAAALPEPESTVDTVSGDDDADADEDKKGEAHEPIDIINKYLSTNQPPLGLLDILSEQPVEGGAVGKMKLFYAALLGGHEGRLVDRMQARDKYILSLKRDDKSQAAQLIALEHYLTQVEAERMSEMPFVLKYLFEEDLIEEDIIVAWGDAPAIAKKHGVDKVSAQQIRELSQKVLEWLQEDSDCEEE
jgi:hypothetical protein